MELTPKQKSFLRSRAHDLNPVVMTGSNGLTEAVLKEIEQAIAHHELIKIKLGGVDKETRKTMTQTICEKLGSHSHPEYWPDGCHLPPGKKPQITLP